MSFKPSIVQPFVDWVAKHYGKDTGKMLIHTGVIGWALSAAAQVTAICVNDKIPKKQKMFMVPQEIADALVNIVSFYAITQTCKSFALNLVKSGKLLPKNVRNAINLAGFGDKCGKKGFNVYNGTHLSPATIKELAAFHNGVDVIATTTGSIISCNLVTPIVRNYLASKHQKAAIAKMEAKETPSLNNGTNYFTKPSMSAFMHSGSLKV
jgi:hypothetical protein